MTGSAEHWAGWLVIVLVVFKLQSEKARHGASQGHVYLSIRKG